MEQLVARQAHNLEVARSNPASATNEKKRNLKRLRFFFLSRIVQGAYLELFKDPDSLFRAWVRGEKSADEFHQSL